MSRKVKPSLTDFENPGIVQEKILVKEIGFSPLNPRTYFDPQKLEELAASFNEHEMLTPVIVRPITGKDTPYELVAGERRIRAAQLAGIKEVEVKIRELSDRQALAIALEENFNREDLNPIEETVAILNLLSLDLNLERDEITSYLYKMNKGRDVPNDFKEQVDKTFESIKNLTVSTFIKDRLRLLKLPLEILDAIQKGNLQYTKGILIARIKDKESRNKLLREAIEQKLTIVQIKEKIAKSTGDKKSFNYQDLPTDELVQNVKQTYSKLSRNKKVWQDPRNRSKIESLLKSLNKLLDSA